MQKIIKYGLLTGLVTFAPAIVQPSSADEPIQGRIEHNAAEIHDYDLKPMTPSPDRGEYLRGRAKQDALKGDVDESGWEPEPGTAELDKEIGMLKGTAKKQSSLLQGQDPDAEDQQLMIEWDRWRNRFLRAVQLGTMEILNNQANPPYKWDPVTQQVSGRYPMGTEAAFAVQVTPNLKIQNYKLLKSSGFPEFDQALHQAVKSLEDTKILRYPDRSKRPIVSQAAAIRTAQTDSFQYHKFGDVERQVIPGN